MKIDRMTIALINVTFMASSLCFSCDDQSWHVPSDDYFQESHVTMKDIGKVGLVIGIAGLATYGIVKFGEWLFRKSDETATDFAQKAAREASAQYAAITTILNNTYAGAVDRQACITDISESTLYDIAKSKYHDADIAIYLQRLAGTLQQLKRHAKAIHERIQVALSQNIQDYETLRLISRMKAVENSIETLLPSLTFAYDYLNYHRTFFALFEAEDNMMYRYERDLNAINTYQGDLNYLREMIHQSVMIYQRRHADPYPYRWYLKRLEDDIHLLHVAMNRLSYTYTNRLSVASTLCNKLEFIRETLIGSPYYAEELRVYEYAKIAQAALEAQQRQARAQEQLARQLRHQYELQATHHIDWA